MRRAPAPSFQQQLEGVRREDRSDVPHAQHCGPTTYAKHMSGEPDRQTHLNGVPTDEQQQNILRPGLLDDAIGSVPALSVAIACGCGQRVGVS